jgi:hypothetical protein
LSTNALDICALDVNFTTVGDGGDGGGARGAGELSSVSERVLVRVFLGEDFE